MADVAERVRKVVAETLKVELGRVTNEARFVQELDASSMASVELVAAFEDEFDIEMDEQDALGIKTVGHAIEYIDNLVSV